MNPSITLTLSPEALKGLGSLIKPQTVLSPFDVHGTLDQTQLAAHKQSGLLDSMARPSATFGPTLDTLAAPASFVQLRLQAGPEFFEHLAFFSADSAHSVLLTTSGTDLVLSDPVSVPGLVDLVRQYVGTSVLRAPTFDTEIEYAAAVVLGAAIDLYRRAELRTLADQAEFTAPSFDAQAIEAAIAHTPEDLRWLVAMLQSIRPGERANGSVGPMLEQLVAAGHLGRTGTRYYLTSKPALLAERLLVPDNLLMVSTGQLGPDGGVTVTQLLCLQAGLHDLLTIERCEGNVRFECLSAAALVEFVNQVLSHPNAVGGAGDAKTFACPRCHAPNSPLARFCEHCGLSLDTNCRQCGAPLQPAWQICPQCGTARTSREA
jgi:hypothetical protein